jgi:hypothetical protein
MRARMPVVEGGKGMEEIGTVGTAAAVYDATRFRVRDLLRPPRQTRRSTPHGLVTGEISARQQQVASPAVRSSRVAFVAVFAIAEELLSREAAHPLPQAQPPR